VRRLKEPAQGFPRIPTWLLVTAGVVVATNIVLMVAGAIYGGVTLDEPSHVHRLQGFLSNGWYVADQWVVNGKVTQEGGYVYAPAAALLGHFVGVLGGTETWSTVSEDAAAYSVRHLVIVALGLLGIAAVAATARLLLRSWRWGLVAAAILTAIPMYAGNAMFNIKDPAVAAGYAVATLGAVALTRPSIRSGRMRLLAGGALAAGIWLAAGVRPAMLVSIGVSVAVALAASWLRMRRDDATARERMKARLVTAVGGSSVGYLALVATYPKLFLRPDLMYQGVAESGHFPWHLATLTAGTFMPGPGAPPSYLPLWFAAQTPVVTSLLCLGAILWFFRQAFLPEARKTGDGSLLAGAAVILVQALFLPWVAIAGGSTLYQGPHQMLFVVPAIALLATIGASLFVRAGSASGRSHVVSALWAVMGVMLAVTTVSSAAIFPYAYTWFNAATALRPIDGNWVADVEWQSSREVLPMVDSLDEERCVLLQPHTHCDRDQVAPFAHSVGEQPVGPPLAQGEVWRLAYGQPVARTDAPGVDRDLVHDCRRVAAVTRQLFWRTVTMSTVERCRR
jgi:hypothetical protein